MDNFKYCRYLYKVWQELSLKRLEENGEKQI